MNLSRRNWVTAGASALLLQGLPAISSTKASRPLVVFLDTELQSSRDAYRKFGDVMAQHFAARDIKPELRFVVSQVPITPQSVTALRATLVDLRPNIIVGANPALARAARDCGLGVPILFFSIEDPVASGLTDSLVHPGTGMTGFTIAANSTLKRQEMLLRLVPGCRIMGRLIDDSLAREGVSGAMKDSEQWPGVIQRRYACTNVDELAAILRRADAREADAWDIGPIGLPWKYPEGTIQLFNQLKRPAIYTRLRYVEMGAMAAYEPLFDDSRRAWSSQIEMLLNGVPIRELPVVQSTRFSFGLNLKACRNAGIRPSKSLLKIADMVIE